MYVKTLYLTHDTYIDGLNLRSNLVSCVTASTTHVIREELASFFCSENMKVCYNVVTADNYAVLLLVFIRCLAIPWLLYFPRQSS